MQAKAKIEESGKFSKFGPVEFDSLSKEVIGWGYKLREPLLPEEFEHFGTMGEWITKFPSGEKLLVLSRTTRADLVSKYGMKEGDGDTWGPRGGWKSVIIGGKEFGHKALRP